MAPRKAARARSRRESTTRKDEPRPSGHLIRVESIGELPLVIRAAMLKELMALDGGNAATSPANRDPSHGDCAVSAETRGQALINRTTRLLDELNDVLHTLEVGVIRVGGNWPWPDPSTAGDKGAIADPTDFQSALELRLDRLHGQVRHVGILAQRLSDIA